MHCPSFCLVFQYGLNELKLRFRTRLSRHLYDKYLKGFTYYKMSNLDNRIANADQLLTQDVEKLSNSVGELYSNLSKVCIITFAGIWMNHKIATALLEPILIWLYIKIWEFMILMREFLKFSVRLITVNTENERLAWLMMLLLSWISFRLLYLHCSHKFNLE